MAEDDKKDDPKPNDAEDKEKEDGEEGEGGEEGLNPPKGKLGKKKLIIIGAVAAVLLLGGGGAGLYFAGVFGSDKAIEGAELDAHGQPVAQAEDTSHEDDKKDDKYKPVFLSLGEILVNLSGGGKRPNFLKIKVDLELASEKDKDTLIALKPRIIDNFQVYLRELRIEDLRGSAGLYRLREELLLRVTEAVQPIRIRDVLFQEMLVQ